MSKEIHESGIKIHKAIKVIPLNNYELYIEFDDGVTVNFDMKKLLNHPLFKSLNDINIFKKVWIDGSAICWENDIDICADSLYPKPQK